MITKAIVRPPAPNFAEGLTTVDLGAPIYEKALAQHERYCAALEEIGLRLVRLPPDPLNPDSTFVEDTAILTERAAILARPGADSRLAEVDSIREALAGHYAELAELTPPGTLDGGDVCQTGGRFFIGISMRTNEEGARQLEEALARSHASSTVIDIREIPGILHLKSGLAYIGGDWLVVIEALANHPALRPFNQIRVVAGEEYAANCLRVNDHVLVPAGYPTLEATLRGLGHKVIALEMSEFQKMDGGLSCLSLRF